MLLFITATEVIFAFAKGPYPLGDICMIGSVLVVYSSLTAISTANSNTTLTRYDPALRWFGPD